MLGCVLRIGGERFSADSFVANSSLVPIAVFHKGESIAGTKRLATCDGVNIDVSRADGSSLPQQIADAVQFLRTHLRELQRLRDDLGRDAMWLDFGLWDTATDDRTSSNYSLRPELLTLAGELGIEIELSFYGREIDTV